MSPPAQNSLGGAAPLQRDRWRDVGIMGMLRPPTEESTGAGEGFEMPAVPALLLATLLFLTVILAVIFIVAANNIHTL
jgi:hypothetical protein